MNDPKRQEIKDRIAVGQARNESRGDTDSQPGEEAAHKPDQSVIGFVKAHPIATIAGALAIGVVVAGMFPATRKAVRRKGRKKSRSVSVLGALGTQAAVAGFQHLLQAGSEAARAGGARLDDLSDTIGETARNASREALQLAERSGESAREATRDGRKALDRSLRRIIK